MQLAVDIGNTRVKCGLFREKELLFSEVSEKEAVYAIKDIYEENPGITAIIISSVRESLDADLIPIPETIHHIILDHETPLPIKIDYGSPETLGHDRIALAVAANAIFPKKNSLVIDAGTCVTYDLISNEGIYLGGSIAPGVSLRLNAMHEGTARLPKVDFDSVEVDSIGKNTVECMKSGAVNGLKNEIIGTISSFEKQFKDLQVLLTGGDIKVFDNELKSGFFADPNLVLRGLNYILLYNVEKS